MSHEENGNGCCSTNSHKPTIKIDVKLAQAHHFYWVGDLPALRAVADELAPLVDAYGGPAQRTDFHHVRMQEALRREGQLTVRTAEIRRARAGRRFPAADCPYGGAQHRSPPGGTRR